MSVGVFGVELDNFIEVFYCSLMVANHLVGFSPFVNESYVSTNLVDAVGKRKDRLLKLFDPTVGKSHVVVDVAFLRYIGSVPQCKFQEFDALFVLGSCEVSQPLPLQEQGVVLVKQYCGLVVPDAVVKLTQGKVALCPVHEVGAVAVLHLYSVIIVLKRFAIVLQRLVALPQSVKNFLNLRVLCCLRLANLEILKRLSYVVKISPQSVG